MNEVMPLKSIRDIERIKESLSNNPRNLLLFTIGINTALRISDILTLKVRDVSDTHIEITERKRSEEHTSELQSRGQLVCRLLLENKLPSYTTSITDRHRRLYLLPQFVQ